MSIFTSDEEFDYLCEDIINEIFCDPPYVLTSGETVTEDDHGAVYAYTALRAAFDDTTSEMDEEEVKKWIYNQVLQIASKAQTYKEAINSLNGPAATPEFKEYAIEQIKHLDLSLYEGDSSTTDYRYNQWINNVYENYQIQKRK